MRMRNGLLGLVGLLVGASALVAGPPPAPVYDQPNESAKPGTGLSLPGLVTHVWDEVLNRLTLPLGTVPVGD